MSRTAPAKLAPSPNLRRLPLSTTLYQHVARDLASGIVSGRYPVGSLLPTEMELAALYAASRQTVRAALQELQALGLVSRRKRVGTRVEATTSAVGYRQSLASLEDLVNVAAHQVRVIKRVESIVVDRALAQQLRCAAGRRWHRIDILRYDDKSGSRRPVGWTQAYVDADYGDVPKLLRKCPKALIGSLIEAHYGRRIAKVEQTVEAVAIPASVAKLLDALPGSPALKVTRRYMDHVNDVFEISVTIHPADRMVFSTTLHRDVRSTAA